MAKEVLTFSDIKTEIVWLWIVSSILEDVDIDNILLSNKISFGEKSYKYLTDYLCDDYENKPSWWSN